MPRPLIEHELSIKAAMWAVERGGFCVSWILPAADGDAHTFRAVDRTGDTTTVQGADPLKAITELMELLGFEDLD